MMDNMLEDTCDCSGRKKTKRWEESLFEARKIGSVFFSSLSLKKKTKPEMS